MGMDRTSWNIWAWVWINKMGKLLEEEVLVKYGDFSAMNIESFFSFFFQSSVLGVYNIEEVGWK